ncbi:unnamed protein product [Notodromas monacha]|uniref:Glucose-methanol-choline oxidoreductase N-terminal domain-containing protein n=1 Tax=Notodromas monacha TaxID=399045 RepID=A0A7R9BE85_9CRUS|nr:unnamed protein product [Notodromas monacha]CAG0913767.1 unnamed protein product [Notodromas monacha]
MQTNISKPQVLVDPAHDRAVGVSFRRAGRDYDVLASKEVIVSAGVVESPKLLMLSGIGPADELRRLGLSTCLKGATESKRTKLFDDDAQWTSSPSNFALTSNYALTSSQIHVSKDLPGVGKNMRSHVGAGGIYFTTSQPVGMSLFRDLTIRSLASYAFRGGGQLNSPGGLEGIAFISSNYSTDPTWPDVEILFGSTHIASDGGLVYRRLLNLTEEVWETYRDLRWRDGFMMLPFPTRPKSRGQIRLRSANPEEDPEIIGNYFKHPEDMQITVDAIKFLMKIAETPAMKEVGAELYAHTLPGCEQHTRFSDAYWECHTRHFTYLHWHDSSTCQMGPEYNPETVVDSRLRVHGINSLRVADASIMPEIVSGDTQAACIMIGEKAASMIKEDHQLLTARSRLLRI